MKQNTMTYSEIGSYFWMDEMPVKKDNKAVSWLPKTEDSAFTYSGRAAIEIAVKDILSVKKISKVYAPSYCCISMLQPFIAYGMIIQFYDVFYEDRSFKYDIDYEKECDAVLIMSYFGLGSDQIHKAIEIFRSRDVIIIQDITHSLLSKDQFSPFSNYLIASLRKWFAVPTGGWVGKTEGLLTVKPNRNSIHAADEKIRGMKEKDDYIKEKTDTKEKFLMLQAKFENELEHLDCMLQIDSISYQILCNTDVTEIREKRRKNAQVLKKGLEGIDSNILTFPEFHPMEDTLLFLPVFMKRDNRNRLKEYLISRRIYCPVHWPKITGVPAKLKDNELSLICDQRYSEGDMKVIAGYIQEWCCLSQKDNRDLLY